MAIFLSLLLMDVLIFLALAQEHDIPVHDTLTGWVVFFQPRGTMPDLFRIAEEMWAAIQRSESRLANRGLIIDSQEFHSD